MVPRFQGGGEPRNNLVFRRDCCLEARNVLTQYGRVDLMQLLNTDDLKWTWTENESMVVLSSSGEGKTKVKSCQCPSLHLNSCRPLSVQDLLCIIGRLGDTGYGEFQQTRRPSTLVGSKMTTFNLLCTKMSNEILNSRPPEIAYIRTTNHVNLHKTLKFSY